MTLDHVSRRVGDLGRSRGGYLRGLAPLGITVLMEGGGAVGFGRASNRKPGSTGAPRPRSGPHGLRQPAPRSARSTRQP